MGYTDFKFGLYIKRVHPNKSPFKNVGENLPWAYPEMLYFLSTHYSNNSEVVEMAIGIHRKLYAGYTALRRSPNE